MPMWAEQVSVKGWTARPPAGSLLRCTSRGLIGRGSWNRANEPTYPHPGLARWARRPIRVCSDGA